MRMQMMYSQVCIFRRTKGCESKVLKDLHTKLYEASNFKLGNKYRKNSVKAEIMSKLIVDMRNEMHIPTEERCAYNDKCRCQLYSNSSGILMMTSADVSRMLIVVK